MGSARFFLILLLLSAPPVAAGYYFADVKGAVVGFVLADLLLIIAAYRSERTVVRALNASSKVPAGLSVTFARAHEDLVEKEGFRYTSPQVLIYADPAPNAVVARGFGSPGSILLSQGLLGLLSERELRAVIRECIRRNDDPDWLFNTLCASFAAFALRWAPEGWARAVFSGSNPGGSDSGLGTLQLIPFVLILPAVRFFVGLCRAAPDHLEVAEVDLAVALRKARLVSAKCGRNELPAVSPLFLVDPGPADRIL